MQRTILLPMVHGHYDPEIESFPGAFSISKKECAEFLRRMYQRREESPDRYTVDYFLDMVEAGEVSDSMFLYLSGFGAQSLWDTMKHGVSAILGAEEGEE